MLEQLIISVQLILINIVMAADNAIIIGLIAASFAEKNRKRIIAWGIAAAFIFRIMFATGANFIFEFAWVKILGGVAFVTALLAGNAKLDESFYKNDPQIIQLEKDLLRAKESGDKEKIKDIARKLKNRKIVVTPFK